MCCKLESFSRKGKRKVKHWLVYPYKRSVSPPPWSLLRKERDWLRCNCARKNLNILHSINHCDWSMMRYFRFCCGAKLAIPRCSLSSTLEIGKEPLSLLGRDFTLLLLFLDPGKLSSKSSCSGVVVLVSMFITHTVSHTIGSLVLFVSDEHGEHTQPHSFHLTEVIP